VAVRPATPRGAALDHRADGERFVVPALRGIGGRRAPGRSRVAGAIAVHDLLEGLPRLDDDDAFSAWLERTMEDDASDLSSPRADGASCTAILRPEIDGGMAPLEGRGTGTPSRWCLQPRWTPGWQCPKMNEADQGDGESKPEK
jgi:hypothetical protein